MIGAVAMGFYSLANPQGMAHPLVFASQVLGRAVVGAMGGWAASIGLPGSLPLRSLALAGWAVVSSVSYDLLTNVASGMVYGQMIPSLILGIPWALAHLASNAVFFIVIGLPLIRLLEPRRAQLLGIAVFVFAGASAGPVAAQTPPDSSRAAAEETDTVPAAVDSVSSSARDSLAEAAADSVSTAGQSADSLQQGDSLVVQLRTLPSETPPSPRWQLNLGPAVLWRRRFGRAAPLLGASGRLGGRYQRRHTTVGSLDPVAGPDADRRGFEKRMGVGTDRAADGPVPARATRPDRTRQAGCRCRNQQRAGLVEPLRRATPGPAADLGLGRNR
jgi:hypothetical protein